MSQIAEMTSDTEEVDIQVAIETAMNAGTSADQNQNQNENDNVQEEDEQNPNQNGNTQNTVAVPVETAPLKEGRDPNDSESDDEEAQQFSLKRNKTIRTHFSDAFEWTHPLLHHYPAVWVRRDPDKTSQTKPNSWAVAFSIATVLLYFVLQFFYQITGWNLFPAIDNAVWCLYIIFVCAARVLSISYFAKFFNWPWSRESLPFYYQQQTELGNKDRVANYRRLYFGLSIAYILLDLAVVIMETEALMPYYHFSVLTYILVKSLCRIFLFYPLLLTTLVQSIVFVKYLLCLDQLWQEMKTPQTVDLQTTFEEYEKLYKSFRRDYHGTLRLSVSSYLAAEVLFFWDSFNFMGMHAVMIVLLLRAVPIFWLFFHSASNLEKTHRQLSDEVWKHGQYFMATKNKKNGHDGYYNLILQFLHKYSIYLTVGKIVVTTKNVMKFCCILMITRSFTYFGTTWAESKM
eukprot:314423_1